MEADTVAHCGGSLSGEHCWSVTVSDVHTQWTKTRATANRGREAVLRRIAEIEECLPFAVLGFDTDNGGEFLNWHLVDYFQKREKPVAFTRSRAYRKNDNARVEQKNRTHVRELMGYGRLELLGLQADLVGRSALVGDGMILLNPRPRQAPPPP